MKSIHFFLILVLVAAVACSPKVQSSDNQSQIKRQWMLKTLPGVADSLVIRSGASIDLTDLTKTGGKAGCNRAMFKTTTDGAGSISFSQAATTRMFCKDFMEVEAAYVKTLPEIKKYELKGHQISFQDAAGNTLIEAVAADWD
ncbi:hypothetical protein GCM10027051_13040 [Niabella terrae]